MLPIYGARRLSRLEAALYVLIAAVAALALLAVARGYFADTERATVQVTLVNLQSALGVRLAMEIMRGGTQAVEDWPRRDPFELAGIRPSGHAGALPLTALNRLEPGGWAFDTTRSEVVYRPRFIDAPLDPAGVRLLRYRLVLRGESGSWAPRMRPVAGPT